MRIVALTLTAVALSGCSLLSGKQGAFLGDNQTGAGVAVTPATSGITSITVGTQQACTEPRPSAAVTLVNSLTADGSLQSNSQANLDTTLKIVNDFNRGIDQIDEFERIEFLSHGLFGICQIFGSLHVKLDPKSEDKNLPIRQEEAQIISDLIEVLIIQAATMSPTPTRSATSNGDG